MPPGAEGVGTMVCKNCEKRIKEFGEIGITSPVLEWKKVDLDAIGEQTYGAFPINNPKGSWGDRFERRKLVIPESLIREISHGKQCVAYLYEGGAYWLN